MSAGLPYPYVDSELHERRERVFLILAGLFIGSMTMLNILGVSRFLDLSFEIFGLTIPLPLAVGVLPYPITFLCTDFISELYGRQRANHVVFVGLLLNVFVVTFLWIGGAVPPVPILTETGLPDTTAYDFAFYRIRQLTIGAVFASMIAYLAAQLCDVWLFHFWKRLTGGRHLWLRNNGSTLGEPVRGQLRGHHHHALLGAGAAGRCLASHLAPALGLHRVGLRLQADHRPARHDPLLPRDRLAVPLPTDPTPPGSKTSRPDNPAHREDAGEP